MSFFKFLDGCFCQETVSIDANDIALETTGETSKPATVGKRSYDSQGSQKDDYHQAVRPTVQSIGSFPSHFMLGVKSEVCIASSDGPLAASNSYDSSEQLHAESTHSSHRDIQMHYNIQYGSICEAVKDYLPIREILINGACGVVTILATQFYIISTHDADFWDASLNCTEIGEDPYDYYKDLSFADLMQVLLPGRLFQAVMMPLMFMPVFVHLRSLGQEAHLRLRSGVRLWFLFSIPGFFIYCFAYTLNNKLLSTFAIGVGISCNLLPIIIWIVVRMLRAPAGIIRSSKYLTIACTISFVFGALTVMVKATFMPITLYLLMVISLILSLLWIFISLTIRPAKGELSLQILTGVIMIAHPKTSLSLMHGLRQKLGMVQCLGIWVCYGYLAKAAFTTYAANAVPDDVWTSVFVFPLTFLDDFIPAIIFASSDGISVEYLILAGLTCLWEIVRDHPPLKEYLKSIMGKCLAHSKASSSRVWSRCSCCFRSENIIKGLTVCFAVATSVAVTLFGGSVAAEALQEATEEALEVREDAEQQVARRIAQKMEAARLNMISEILVASFLVVMVASAWLQDAKQEYNATVVLVGFILEFFTVGVAFTLNVRFLWKTGIALPNWSRSRTMQVQLALFMVAVTGQLLSVHSEARLELAFKEC